MATLSYFEQISACLEHYDSIRELRLRRSVLIKELNTIIGKLLEMEFAIKQQAQTLTLSNQVPNNLISFEEIRFLKELSEKDKYYSELVDCYLLQLKEVEAQLTGLTEEVFEVAC